MFKRFLLSFTLLALLAPNALAVELAEEDALVETSTPDSLICDDCSQYYYGGSSVYITVTTTATTEADKVYVYGTLAVDNSDSKSGAITELRDAFNHIQSVLKPYGTVRRTGLYSYADWEYTNLYDATLSVRLDLQSFGDLSEVEDLFYENGFDNWYEVLVQDTSAAEASVVDELRDMINDKKAVYEDLLGYGIGNITGLTIYSWADSSSFDPSTGEVEVSVNASVTYNPEM